MIKWPSAVLATGILLVAGCDKSEWNVPKISSSEQQQQAPSSNEKPGKMFQAERSEYLKTTRQELDQLRTEIDALQVKANNSGAALKADLDQKIQGFQTDLRSLEEKWQQIKDVSESRWQEIKLSFSASIEKLKKSIHETAG
ncbi:putative lipoprotein [Collimonas arenae]|uniref:Putative lipoprotein n=1 Tax=Collimonas arenae TaxID=279058 RepID=A0A127QJP9_9BURK|nr:hypothetical protein [Collimonas arenae]AMP00116.1 putative lipoprotein [Collimonas arenae]AMP10015.1 putative lipoprotein [Collimonas arenae]